MHSEELHSLFLLQPHGVHSLNLLQTQCAQFVFSASFITVETMPSSLLPRLVSALDVPHGEMTGYGQFILLPWNTSIPLPHYGMYIGVTLLFVHLIMTLFLLVKYECLTMYQNVKLADDMT